LPASISSARIRLASYRGGGAAQRLRRQEQLEGI